MLLAIILDRITQSLGEPARMKKTSLRATLANLFYSARATRAKEA